MNEKQKKKKITCSHVVKIHFPISTFHTVHLKHSFVHSSVVRWLDVSAIRGNNKRKEMKPDRTHCAHRRRNRATGGSRTLEAVLHSEGGTPEKTREREREGERDCRRICVHWNPEREK